MKNLLLKFKGYLGSAWNYTLNHYLCVCAVLITSICFMGYNLKIRADYEKRLSALANDRVEALGLIGNQSEALSLQGEALSSQRSALNDQSELMSRMIKIINEHRATIIQQDQVIQELVKRLRALGGLPEVPPVDKGKWIIFNESS